MLVPSSYLPPIFGSVLRADWNVFDFDVGFVVRRAVEEFACMGHNPAKEEVVISCWEVVIRKTETTAVRSSGLKAMVNESKRGLATEVGV